MDVRVNNIMSRARLYCFKLWNKCIGEQLLIYAFFPEPHKRSFEHVPAGPWKSPSRKPKQLQNLSRSQRLLQRVLQRSASQGVNLHPQHQLQLAGQTRLPLRLRRERSRRPSSFCAVLRCWPMWQIHGWDKVSCQFGFGTKPQRCAVVSFDASSFRLAYVLRYVNSGDYSCDGWKNNCNSWGFQWTPKSKGWEPSIIVGSFISLCPYIPASQVTMYVRTSHQWLEDCFGGNGTLSASVIFNN